MTGVEALKNIVYHLVFHFFSKPDSRLPKNAKIIVFHGCPNPPDAIKGQWGKQLPWYKRWYKRVAPTAWVAEYWR